jgi:hypothetical protein
MDLTAGAGKSSGAIDTALHRRQWVFMKEASRQPHRSNRPVGRGRQAPELCCQGAATSRLLCTIRASSRQLSTENVLQVPEAAHWLW